MSQEHEPAVDLRNVMILLGIVLTTVGLVYFATAFFDLISPWGRVLDMALLSVLFVSLGRHFDQAGTDASVLTRSGWRWLKVSNALYMLGVVSGLTAAIAFLGIDEVPRTVKLLIVLASGIGLILVAAQRMGRRPRA